MKIKHGWTGDRAIGFVIGIMVAACFAVGLGTLAPGPFWLALAFIALGIVLPRASDSPTERT